MHLFFDFPLFSSSKINQLHRQQQVIPVLQMVGHGVELQRVFFERDPQGERSKYIAHPVMLRLPVVVVVDARPGYHRPAVVDLPVECSHAVRPATSHGLYRLLHAVALHHQSHVYKILKTLRLVVIHVHVFFDQRVSRGCFLVDFHHFAFQAPLVGFRKSADGLHLWERLKTELTGEAG